MAKDLKYRFDELITAVRLLPDEPESAEEVIFPNLTRDLHEPELYTAILCQTLKEHKADTEENHEFMIKMITSLVNSAMQSIEKKQEQEDSPSEDDMYSLAVAANIAWATGAGDILFRILGMLSKLNEVFEVEIPHLAFAMLKGHDGVLKFGDLDPYKILAREYTATDMFKIATGEDEVPEDMQEILTAIDTLRKHGDKG